MKTERAALAPCQHPSKAGWHLLLPPSALSAQAPRTQEVLNTRSDFDVDEVSHFIFALFNFHI